MQSVQPFTPGLNVFLNNRDHRKITVIDGKVGFTGRLQPCQRNILISHILMDSGRIQVSVWRGRQSVSLTVTFLEMWNAVSDKDKNDSDFTGFSGSEQIYQAKQTGFIQPYADSPMDHEQVGEEVYISMVNKSRKNIAGLWTPYLINHR